MGSRLLTFWFLLLAPVFCSAAEKPPLNPVDPALEQLLESGSLVHRVRTLGQGNTRKFVLWVRRPDQRPLRTVFKPDQETDGGTFGREIAAYRIARACGIGHVPVTVERTIEASFFANLEVELPPEIRVDGNGMIRGSLQVWVKGARDPFEREARTWALDWLQVLEVPALSVPGTGEARQFSRLVVLDFLIRNCDRYTGGNILRDKTGTYWFIDNAASFTAARRPKRDGLRLRRFDRCVVEHLRRLDLEALCDDLAPYLGERSLRRLRTRTRDLLDHVETLVLRFGEDAIYL